MKHPPDSPPSTPSRREFLSVSARVTGGGWLALHLPLLATLSACSREAASNGDPYILLTEEEARTIDALVARIIPSVDGIGALEAGATHFIDQALAGFFHGDAGFFRSGLAELIEDGFADRSEADQVRHLESIEDTPFFGFARALTIFGTLSDPRHGGGRENAIHRIYAIDHSHAWNPPFGWYDAEVFEADPATREVIGRASSDAGRAQ